MHVETLHLLEGARRARGLAVAIDVLRASSHLVTLFARGAEAVVPVATVEEARALREQHPDWLLAGERHGLPPAGFDLGNSPDEAERRDVAGRTLILTTSAGSKGLVAAAEVADEVIVGCFLNASAVARYAAERGAREVSLLALGVGGETRSPEDDGAATYLDGLLRGAPVPPEPLFEAVRVHPEGQKFLDPSNPNYRAEDLAACLRVDVYDVVPKLSGGVLRR